MSESLRPDPQEQESSISVLLVTAHDWFASALQAVLEPEGFAFARVRSARLAVRDSRLVNPEIVIIGENLPDMQVPELAGALRTAGLRDSVHILVYSPNFWAESDEAAAMAAGAWDIIKEPVRSQLIVAKLRRLLEIKRLIEQTEEGSLADTATGLYNLAGLMRVVRLLEANATRTSVPLSCVVLGPGEPAVGPKLDVQRQLTANLAKRNLRTSDAVGWLGEAELGIVAYNTSAAGVTTMVRRLNRQLEQSADWMDASGPLSAGIVEFPLAGPATEGAQPRSPVASRIASLTRFAAARTALRQAREGGGGIRIAEIS
jgi:PleD family two-component response regulator